MSCDLTELFIHGGIEGFRREVISLDGDFDLSSDSMISLGEAYFEKYPDRFSNRNSEEVRIGYDLARICITEKVLAFISAERKEFYRSAFKDAAAAQAIAGNLAGDPLSAAEEIEGISARLKGIKDIIDEIPRGMIKERYVGGITHLFNVVYLLNMHIKKNIKSS